MYWYILKLTLIKSNKCFRSIFHC